MQNAAHGTAFMRFGEMSSSQCRHTPYEPSAMRASARRICRSMFESRSRLRIASSRSPANCTSSRASGAFSMAISSRLRSEPLSSRCFVSSMVLNFSSSALVISYFLVFQTSPCFFCLDFLFCGTDENSASKFQITLLSGGAPNFSQVRRFLFPLLILTPQKQLQCQRSRRLQVLYRLPQSNAGVYYDKD